MKHKIFKTLLVFISAFFLNTQLTFGASVQSILHDFIDHKGQKASLRLLPYINHNKELEVRIEATGVPRFADKVNPLIGFGRDLDHNGLIDTWFILTKNGIERVSKEGKKREGTDVLNEVLRDRYKSTFRLYASSVALSIFSYLSLSAHEGRNIQEEFYQEWMDLEQLRLRSELEMDMMLFSYSRNQAQFYSELISFGYKDLANRMERFAKRSFWGYAFADIGLWITGTIVIKWCSKFLAKVGLVAAENAFIQSVKEIFIGFFEKQKHLLESRIQALRSKSSLELAKKEVTMALTVATYKQALQHSLRAQNLRYGIHKKFTTAIGLPKLVAKGALSEWKYIAINSTVQLGSEAYVRYDEIYDPNPILMAKNLLMNPDVQQNVGYMATETIMMIGVSKNLKTIKGKFLASAAVALTNSTIMNFVIKDEADLSRVVFDTGWEAIIGNGQVQLDLMALNYFEKMAQKQNNPKIHLVGYAVALVDMSAGYIIYSKATTALDKANEASKNGDTKVTLIPIFAEK